MTKRKKFVLTSILLSLGFVGIQFLPNNFRFLSIGVLGMLTLILFFWSLREGLGKDMTLITLILPFMFTIGVGLFWFLLPSNLLARIPIVIFYGLGIYGLCLTVNIYTVAAIRTIALLRAAKGVGFLTSLVTLFLVYDTVLSIKLQPWYLFILVYLISFTIFLQGFWSTTLEKRLETHLLIISAIASLIVAEVAVSLFFWPVTVVVGSLYLTVVGYILLGLGQAKLEGRLFKQTVREYLVLGAAVFIGMFFATRWGA